MYIEVAQRIHAIYLQNVQVAVWKSYIYMNGYIDFAFGITGIGSWMWKFSAL